MAERTPPVTGAHAGGRAHSGRLILALFAVLCALAPVAAGAQTDPPVTGPVPATNPPTTTDPPTTAPPTTVSPAPTVPSPATVPPAVEPGPTTTDTTVPPDVTPPRLRIHLDHTLISPNGDRVVDKARFEIRTNEAVELRIVIRNAAGTARRTIERTLDRGRSTVTWSGRVGRTGASRHAPDGQYTARLVATDAAGNATRRFRTIRVDTTPPTFGWRSITPDPWGATGALSYNFVSNDASGRPLQVLVYAFDRTGLRDQSPSTARNPGSIAFSWRPDYGTSLFLPGNYFATVRITDAAGNYVVAPFRGFRVDRPVSSLVVRRVEGVGGRVALTFDDCNDGNAWWSILSTLDAYGVDATFFCPGDQVYAHPAQARATADAGHSIGSHSAGHLQLTRLSYGDIANRLQIDKNAWWSTAGVMPTPYFRPPYGSYNSTVVAAAGAMGFRYTIIWDVDPNDWRDPGSGVITSRVLNAARSGSIILMHVKSQTAAALPAILSGLRARGLTPLSMAQLFNAGGVR